MEVYCVEKEEDLFVLFFVYDVFLWCIRFCSCFVVMVILFVFELYRLFFNFFLINKYLVFDIDNFNLI